MFFLDFVYCYTCKWFHYTDYKTPLQIMEIEKQQLIEFADKVNSLGWSLSQFYYRQNRGNECFAPYTLYSLLALLYEGSRNHTEAEIKKFLDFQLPKEELAHYIQTYNQLLKLSFGNLLALNKDIEPLWGFQNRLLKYYEADILPINHAEPRKTVENINKWVNDKTNGLINGILKEELSPETDLLLASSLYFSEKWLHEFPEESTQDGVFVLENREKIIVQMMRHEFRGYYGKNEEVEIIGLKYKGPYMMLIILPNPKINLSTIEEKLSVSYCDSLFSSMKWENVMLSLPKFSLEFEYDLSEILKEMGLLSCFSANADFGAISNHPLLINMICKKTKINVHENGTEAAAVVYASFSRGFDNETKIVSINRPFLFNIIHTQTGMVLFTGRISNPLI